MTTHRGPADAESARIALVTNVIEYGGPGAARGLADAGYCVVCHDRTFKGRAACDTYASENPGLLPVPEQEPQELVDAVLARHGRIDVVVSNDVIDGTLWDPDPELPAAGVPYMRSIAFESVDAGEFRATLEQLVVRPFLLAQAVLPSMRARRSGALIFVTSAVSYRAGPFYEMYSAARSAMTSMAQGLAIQVAPSDIQVNPIGPAWFENPTYYPERHRDRWEPEARREVPLGRLGRQEELGALVVFLASGQALPLTGQFLPFTAGTRLRR